jgi:GAF domain-containing protein
MTTDGGLSGLDLLAVERAEDPDRLARLMRLASRLTRAVTVQQVADAVVAASTAELVADAVTIYEFDQEEAVFQRIAATPMSADLNQRFATVPAGADLPAGECLRTGQALVYTSIEERNRRWSGITSREGMPSTVVAPLLGNGRLRLGVLSIGWREPGPVSDDDVAFVQAVADLCAQSLHRARLHDEQQRAHEVQRTLADATARLAESLDPDKTLTEIAMSAVPVLADVCAVCLNDVDDPHLVVPVAAAHADPAQQILVEQLVVRQPVIRNPRLLAVIEEGSPVLLDIDDTTRQEDAEDAEHLALLTELAANAAIAAPLRTRGEVLGILVLITTGDHRRLGQADLQIATELADRAALAISNARLHERLRTRTGHLERALDSRIVIEQAKGFLAGRHGMDVNEAFDRLRAAARHHRRRIHELAAAVVAGEDLPDVPAPD